MFYQEALYVGRQKVGQALNLVHKCCDLRATGEAVQDAGSSWILQNALAKCIEDGGDICSNLLDLAAQGFVKSASYSGKTDLPSSLLPLAPLPCFLLGAVLILMVSPYRVSAMHLLQCCLPILQATLFNHYGHPSKIMCMPESAHHWVVAGANVGEDAAEEGRPGGVVQDRRQRRRQCRDQPLRERVICHDLLQGTCMQATTGRISHAPLPLQLPAGARPALVCMALSQDRTLGLGRRSTHLVHPYNAQQADSWSPELLSQV